VKVFKKYGWRKIAVIQVERISFDLTEVSLKRFQLSGVQKIKDQPVDEI
jgi:hypothetical protein